MPETPDSSLDLSVVAPAHNEAENVHELVRQVHAALEPLPIRWEFVIVDDGSTDRTAELVTSLLPDHPFLRLISMRDTPPGKGNGQSAAFHAGFRAARGNLIAVLDADLQNDPADIPAMLDLIARTNADMVQGDRSHARKDSPIRRIGSIVGRLARRWLLGDTIRDTGCSLRVFKRSFALRLPLEFRGMHRFIPVSVAHMGGKVVEMPVNHRPRLAGTTKYGFGLGRAIPGLIDLLAVRYMRNRRRPTASAEITPARHHQPSNHEPPRREPVA